MALHPQNRQTATSFNTTLSMSQSQVSNAQGEEDLDGTVDPDLGIR